MAAAVSCIHWGSRHPCWFILNLIADGSIRVEWREPVQFNSTPMQGGEGAACGRDGKFNYDEIAFNYDEMAFNYDEVT